MRDDLKVLIAALDTRLLDTPAEETFDRVTRMVCRLLDVPVSLFSIVDASRQFFKSAHGLAEPLASLREMPLSHSICQHVVRLGQPLAIGDTAAEISLLGNLAVTEFDAQAYLGVPVRNADGHVVASLCAIGHETRTWRADDLATMRDLAAMVESELHLRSEILSRREAERDLRLNEARLRSIADAAPAMMWQTDQRGASTYRSQGWQDFTGKPSAQALGFGWLDAVHPEDRARIGETILHANAARQAFHADYRLLRADGIWRRIADAGNPHYDDDGAFLGLVGSAYDDTERRQAEETREFVGRELSHRIKNVFAMISGLVGLSARDHDGARDFALTLRDRIAALARAHEFALPNMASPGSGEPRTHTMTVLLGTLLAPYQSQANAARIVIAVEDITVGSGAAVTLAMLLHELTTNAVKYGALAADAGQIVLRGQLDRDDYVLIWEERGGPAVDGPPSKQGFGTLMVQRAANLQLEASCNYAWERAGLRLTLRIPAARVAI
jgi:PAS domain S-box-containing protein